MTFYCPTCYKQLSNLNNQHNILVCKDCNETYKTSNGYFIFDKSQMVNLKDYNLDISILNIENKQLLKRLDRWLLTKIDVIKGKKILSIGCGVGSDIIELNRLGAEAYGMDFKYRTVYWNNKDYSNDSLFISSMAFVPFPDDYFDLI
jgi:2-polyprenyl-3-methyl-5-hydroxy-6-metoxy-1,4-benzoquinol methylase